VRELEAKAEGVLPESEEFGPFGRKSRVAFSCDGEESCGVEDEDTDLSRDIPGTLQNPYIVYDHGFPTAQLNTPQVNPPPNQPLLVTPLGRPPGTISATHSAAVACSDAASTRAPPGAS